MIPRSGITIGSWVGHTVGITVGLKVSRPQPLKASTSRGGRSRDPAAIALGHEWAEWPISTVTPDP